MKDRKKLIQRILRVSAYIFVWLFFLYTLIGFVIIPFGLKWFLENKAPEICQHAISVRKIFFNPFSLRLRLHEFDVSDKSGQSLFSFNYLDINVRFYQLSRKKYHFRYMILDGFHANIIINQAGELNLLNLLPPETRSAVAEKPPEQPTTPPVVSENEGPASPVHVAENNNPGLPEFLIDYLTISKSAAYIRDENVQHPFEHTFKAINLKLENVSTIPNDDSQLTAEFELLNGGQIFVGANLVILPLKVTVDLSVQDFPLTSLQPFVDKRLNVTVQDGLFFLHAVGHYDSAPAASETLSLTGDFGIDSFRLHNKAEVENTLLGWDRLIFSQVKFLLSQNQLSVAQVRLHHPQVRFLLNPEGHNFQSIVKTQDIIEETGTSKDEQNTTASSLPKDSAPDIPHQPDDSPLDDLSLSVAEVLLTDGQIYFEDHTVEPAFNARLDQLRLQLKGLSNKPHDPVDIAFTALLNESGQLDISGSAKPLQQPLDLSMDVMLKGYAMQNLTPYIGKFAGYQAEQGKIQLQLNYQIVQDEINADHNVLINNFEFGDKVNSEHTVKVPFKLALSLLEDINNQIHITLPVNGNIADPKFKYSHMISKTLINFFIKIIAKPFTFLASVAGGEAKDQELNILYFPYGESRIDETEGAKLLQLIDGLKQRPRLSIAVQGTYDSVKDWWVIKTKAFNQDYQAFLKEYTRSEEWIIIRLYQKSFGLKEYLNQKKIFMQKMLPDKNPDIALLVAELRRQLIENAPANKEALTVLANERAQAVVDFLTGEGGLDPQRVSIKEPKETQPQKDRIPTELNLTFQGQTE